MCQVWVEFVQKFWGGRFLNFENEFLLFCNYLPFEKGLDLHIKNWIRCFVPSLVEIGPVGLVKKIFKVVNLFLLIPNHLPFGKDVALHLNKLESPSPRDTLCQFWLKLAQWVESWSEKFSWAFISGELKISVL